MRTILKTVQIVQQGADIAVETVCVLREDDLKFLEWCINFATEESEYMNALQDRYFKQHKPRVTHKLSALLAGLPVPAEEPAK